MSNQNRISTFVKHVHNFYLFDCTFCVCPLQIVLVCQAVQSCAHHFPSSQNLVNKPGCLISTGRFIWRTYFTALPELRQRSPKNNRIMWFAFLHNCTAVYAVGSFVTLGCTILSQHYCDEPPSLNTHAWRTFLKCSTRNTQNKLLHIIFISPIAKANVLLEIRQ